MGVCMLWTYYSEEREDGVVAGVNATMMSETLKVCFYYEQQIKGEVKGIHVWVSVQRKTKTKTDGCTSLSYKAEVLSEDGCR